jgi:hypothetical protein
MAQGRRGVNVNVIKPRCRDEGLRSKAMSRYERRIYFEWLVEMRLSYARLDDEDRTSVISIDDVLSSEAAMTRFLNGEHPDKETYEWVRRSLAVIRAEVRRT